MKRKVLLLCVMLQIGSACSPGVFSDSASDSGDISLLPVSHDRWLQELENFKGRIVVVDFWATWCAPCLERFPRMVELHQKYESEGVQFVSMSLDDREDPDALHRAREFLRRNDAQFAHYRMDENMVDAFEKLDLLGIPAVYIYDRQGQLRHRLTGDDPNHQFTEHDVEEAIRGLL